MFSIGCSISAEEDLWRLSPIQNFLDSKLVGNPNTIGLSSPIFSTEEVTEHLLYLFESVPASSIKLVGVHKETDRVEKVIVDGDTKVWEVSTDNNKVSKGSNYHYIPLQLNFPKTGVWRLDVFFENRFIKHIIVKVNK